MCNVIFVEFSFELKLQGKNHINVSEIKDPLDDISSLFQVPAEQTETGSTHCQGSIAIFYFDKQFNITMYEMAGG